MTSLPSLPTMGIGSYAAPGWFIAMLRRAREEPDSLGEHDIEELFDDAARAVVQDQLEAGVDVITDGELRRQRFVFEMFDRIEGVRRVPPRRRLGLAGYDKAPSFVAEGKLSAPHGFGLVEDFQKLRRLVPEKPLKMAMPGPLTFTGQINAGQRDPDHLMEEAIGMVRDELTALTKAGADYIQLDEPWLAHAPYGLSLEEGVSAINASLEGISGRLAVHVCFGNNAGRPFASRRLDRLLPALLNLRCHQLALEFANREMAEIEVVKALSEKFEIAAGVVDVKNFYVESGEEVANRVRLCLEHLPSEKLTVTADCGFSALPRYLARKKLAAMVAGAKLVRAEL